MDPGIRGPCAKSRRPFRTPLWYHDPSTNWTGVALLLLLLLAWCRAKHSSTESRLRLLILLMVVETPPWLVVRETATKARHAFDGSSAMQENKKKANNNVFMAPCSWRHGCLYYSKLYNAASSSRILCCDVKVDRGRGTTAAAPKIARETRISASLLLRTLSVSSNAVLCLAAFLLELYGPPLASHSIYLFVWRPGRSCSTSRVARTSPTTTVVVIGTRETRQVSSTRVVLNNSRAANEREGDRCCCCCCCIA